MATLRRGREGARKGVGSGPPDRHAPHRPEAPCPVAGAPHPWSRPSAAAPWRPPPLTPRPEGGAVTSGLVGHFGLFDEEASAVIAQPHPVLLVADLGHGEVG